MTDLATPQPGNQANAKHTSRQACLAGEQPAPRAMALSGLLAAPLPQKGANLLDDQPTVNEHLPLGIQQHSLITGYLAIYRANALDIYHRLTKLVKLFSAQHPSSPLTLAGHLLPLDGNHSTVVDDDRVVQLGRDRGCVLAELHDSMGRMDEFHYEDQVHLEQQGERIKAVQIARALNQAGILRGR